MAVIIALLISPIGAVFWLALGLTILYAVSRTSRERHQYLRAIHPQHSEIAPFFWVGILLGIVISALMLVARLQVSLPALLALSGSTLVGLIFSGWRFSPWWLGLAGLVELLRPTTSQMSADLAVLVGVLWLAQALIARLNRGAQIESPVILQDRRQRQQVAFRLRQFYWVPLFLPVSVDQVAGLPLLSIATDTFVAVGLPLVLGAAFTTQRDRVQPYLRRSWPWFAVAGGGLIVFGLVGRILTMPAMTIALVPVLVSLILGAGLVWQAHQVHLNVTQTNHGVVVIGVVPQTPAAQMDLQPGDRVLTCNHIAVNNAAELYNAIQKEPTYCRLRLQQADGEIRLAETAIFAGAPHELGMILCPEETA